MTGYDAALDRVDARASRPARPRLRGWIHTAAAPVAVVVAVELFRAAAPGASRWSVAVFGIALIGLFTTSGLYHVPNWPMRVARQLARADVAMIQLFIAATFTPVAVHTLSGAWRTWSLVVAWVVAVIGAGVAASPLKGPRWLTVAAYASFGALGAIPLMAMADRLPPMAGIEGDATSTAPATTTTDPGSRPRSRSPRGWAPILTDGLTSDEVAARLERHGPNRLDAAAVVPAWRKLLAQFDDPLVYLLLGAVVVSLVAWFLEGREGTPFEVIVITVIVVFNAVLGYVQEARAEQAVAALQRMAAATATVVRDGREQRIAADDLVPGDILLLGEGDAVGADARLVEAASLLVAEASLTGESQAVLKDVAALAGAVGLGDRRNMVFKGTAVTRGRGRAVVTATGMGTEMGTIARLLGQTEDEPTPLQREIARIGRALGIAVIVIATVVVGAILFTADLQTPSDYVDVLLVGVSLAVAAVPEGLPAVLSVVLALGVQRMAKQRAIVKKLLSVETLGSASVVCSDKTGTLTRNEMTIQVVATASGEVALSGTGYQPTARCRSTAHR
jgi:channel protein (hemolysin III family)